MYALNIDTETNRILSATYSQYAPPTQPRVDTLPEGNITDYLYVDGEYVYDPLPEPEPQPLAPTDPERLRADIDFIAMMEDIPLDE